MRGVSLLNLEVRCTIRCLEERNSRSEKCTAGRKVSVLGYLVSEVQEADRFDHIQALPL